MGSFLGACSEGRCEIHYTVEVTRTGRSLKTNEPRFPQEFLHENTNKLHGVLLEKLIVTQLVEVPAF
jgi:hypothetical protein